MILTLAKVDIRKEIRVYLKLWLDLLGGRYERGGRLSMRRVLSGRRRSQLMPRGSSGQAGLPGGVARGTSM